MSVIGILLLILGIASLFYYGVIISYVNMHASFSWFWLILGFGCIFFYFVIQYILRHDIVVARTIKAVVISVVSIGLCVFIIIEGTIIVHAGQKADKGEDYLIVLGAQVQGTTITRVLKKRLVTAAEYLKENPKTVAIVSGGQGTGEAISEAEAMKQYLLSKGIDGKRIIKEDRSTNTNENIRFSKEIIHNDRASVAVVTNGFHVYRAVSIAKKQGFQNVQGLSAPSDPILFINYYVREALGVMKDKLEGNM